MNKQALNILAVKSTHIEIMDSRQALIILILIKVILFGITSIGTCLYAIPLCFIRHFHTPYHLLSLNVYFSTFICASFWSIYFIMNTYYQDILWTEKSCLLILYLQSTVNSAVLYSLCIVSLNRLSTIVYKK